MNSLTRTRDNVWLNVVLLRLMCGWRLGWWWHRRYCRCSINHTLGAWCGYGTGIIRECRYVILVVDTVVVAIVVVVAMTATTARLAITQIQLQI